MQHPFSALKPEYAALLASAHVTRSGPVEAGIERILKRGLDPYIEVQAATGVPAIFIAVLDLRESNCNPWAGLGQGDDWRKVSRHVPAGHGPFRSWADAAKFYVHYDHLDDVSAPAWSLAYACWKGEIWNGFGPRGHGIHTGYLWSCMSAYDPPRYGGSGRGGKYVADGKWDGSVVDVQPGIIPVMLGLAKLHPELRIGEPAIPADEDAPAVEQPQPPMPQTAPEGTGAGVDGVAALQGALNAVLPPPPLLIDGSYGRRTREAVRQFQASAGLRIDGLYGPKTAAALAAARRRVKA